MPDWDAIRAEYISTDTSFRRLAEKYGVNKDVIARHGKRDGWADARLQIADKAATASIERIAEQKADYAVQLQATAGKLLKAVDELIDEEYRQKRTGKALSDMSIALVNVQKLLMIRSDADIREQEARIAKLRKDVDDDVDKTVTLRIEGGDDSWQR